MKFREENKIDVKHKQICGKDSKLNLLFKGYECPINDVRIEISETGDINKKYATYHFS